jgi:hypothetical protein
MRSTTFAAPLALLAYGVLRWIDGLDGHRKDGLAWDLGHLCFFASMVLFGLLAVMLCRRVPAGRPLAHLAAGSALTGVACMLWVITGDLSEGFRRSLPLPEPLRVAGPALFVLGMVVLLSLRVAAGRMPVWSPVLFFAGYAAITIDLDLLPFAALVILAAVAPLARRGAARAAGSAPATLAGSLSRRA